MGLVKCPKHGDGGSPLCCRHVLDSVYGRGATISFWRIDLVVDGEDILDHLVCDQCIADYELSDQSVRGEVADSLTDHPTGAKLEAADFLRLLRGFSYSEK
jgi:hypothetical protein